MLGIYSNVDLVGSILLHAMMATHISRHYRPSQPEPCRCDRSGLSPLVACLSASHLVFIGIGPGHSSGGLRRRSAACYWTDEGAMPQDILD